MKNFLFTIAAFFCLNHVMAQEDAATLAKNYIREGDYHNAILVLNRAIENDSENVELKKDLAFSYYLSRDYVRAMATAKAINETKQADVQSFQIQGMIHKAIEEKKEAEKMYKSAIKKFPESGVLYNEYGEILWTKGEVQDAVRLWLKGVQVDPNHSGNYYNLAKYYYLSADKIWGLLYGEIFVNLESYSKRTPEIKSLLFEGYKKLFSETNLAQGQDNKNEFTKAIINVMSSNASVVSSGITTDALSALRTRFTLEWFNRYASKFPYRLFDHYQQLAQEGMFDAYNQWLFGAEENLSAFQKWTANHAEEYNKFVSFQKGRVFKLPQGQHYQTR